MSGVMPTGLSDRSEGVRRVVLPDEFSSVPAVRGLVRSDLVARGVCDEVVNNTLLVLSELVSNAVTHASPAIDGHDHGIIIVWTVENDLVLVDVIDGGGRSVPERTAANPLDDGGRGLTLVDAIAQDWSVSAEDGHVTVRAVVGS